MTKKQIKKIVDRLEKNPQTAMIDGETALKAINAVAKIAGKKNIPWALAGGVAMSYYGSPRLTKDVDIISSRILGLDSSHKLGFGGERYTAKVGRKEVPVDWIVRNDDARPLYEAALADASNEEFGIPLISPE